MNVKWVKTYKEFTQFILENGLPSYISFDHDLGDFDSEGNEKTGYDCAKWLVDYCLDNNLDLPKWYVHSGNIVGKENIEFLLNNFSKSNN